MELKKLMMINKAIRMAIPCQTRTGIPTPKWIAALTYLDNRDADKGNVSGEHRRAGNTGCVAVG